MLGLSRRRSAIRLTPLVSCAPPVDAWSVRKRIERIVRFDLPTAVAAIALASAALSSGAFADDSDGANRPAASRTATQAASTLVPKPAAPREATAAKPEAKATTVNATRRTPAASARNGIDLTIPLLSLLGGFAVLLALRQKRAAPVT